MNALDRLKQALEKLRANENIVNSDTYHNYAMRFLLYDCYNEGFTQQEIEGAFEGIPVSWLLEEAEG